MTESAITLPFLVTIIFFAAFEQRISGFGFSLIVMPLVTLALGLHTAAPLVAMAGLTLYAINVIRFREAINANETLRLAIAAAAGVPVGIWWLINLDEEIVKSLLGLILIGYALFSLVRPALPRLESGLWVYLTGFVSGCLGGAYNTPGPPLVVYGSLRQWQKDEFRAVLQAAFLLTGALTVTSHFLTQHLTMTVMTFFAYTAPALILGNLIGSWVDRQINKELFRLVVTGMILLLGVSLILGGR